MAQSRKAENAKKRRRWKKHLEDWTASGVTQVSYCHEHKLSRHQFQYWKKRLHPEKPTFIELRMSSDTDNQPLPLRLMVGNGSQVAVERDFDPVALQQRIGVLSRL